MSLYMEDNFDSTIKYDIAIILGCNNYNIMKERLDSAVYLYNKGIIKEILVSGGKAYFSMQRKKEADIMHSYLIKNGVDRNNIIIENKSRHTRENINYSLKLINDNKKLSILLITSDFHIKRAYCLLKKLTDNNIYYFPVKTDSNKYKRLIRREKILLTYYIKRKYI